MFTDMHLYWTMREEETMLHSLNYTLQHNDNNGNLNEVFCVYSETHKTLNLDIYSYGPAP